ncbi:MAG TPA: DUF6686 family protein [Thermoanaerobaculia bacterium]|jgi:hypothetical protein|nr:DUF6686 family protein [Thermoanaerobaculia bacterium]
MDRPLSASAATADQDRRTTQGRICRCPHCELLQLRFGNLSAHLDAESLLLLASRVQYAFTAVGPKLTGDQRVVIPFGPGHFSLLLDRTELTELHRLVQDGLKWLDGQEAAKDPATLRVH